MRIEDCRIDRLAQNMAGGRVEASQSCQWPAIQAPWNDSSRDIQSAGLAVGGVGPGGCWAAGRLAMMATVIGTQFGAKTPAYVPPFAMLFEFDFTHQVVGTDHRARG
jgi:hypothetical protein